METKGIDLTECRNCRFRARIDGEEVTGRIERPHHGFILTADDRFGCAVELHELHSLLRGASIALEDGEFHITDFEIVPRDPETYQDWQVGDKVRAYSAGVSREVIFRSGELVVTKTTAGTACSNCTCDELFKYGFRILLTDIEKQIIEEREKAEWKPQNGDVCYAESRTGYCAIFIYQHGEPFMTAFYAMIDNREQVFTDEGHAISDGNIAKLRPATDEEKQSLFDAMAKEGKRWNAEKKCVENIPKPYEFKKGEPVLVRNGSFEKWCIAAYCQPEGTTNRVFVGEAEAYFVEVIPYNERTMHLLGTAEDYKEE